jgi:hypothetical protein
MLTSPSIREFFRFCPFFSKVFFDEIYSGSMKENMEGSFAIEEDEVSPPSSSRSSPRMGRVSGTRSAPTGRTTRPASPRSAPKKKSASPPQSPRRTATRGSGDFFVNPRTNRVVNKYSTVKGERQLNKIFTELKNDARGDMTLNLTFYPTKEAAEANAKKARSSASSSKAAKAAQYYVDRSKGKYEKGTGRRGRIVVIHKPKGGDFEGPFASKEAADAWAVDNGYLGKASVSAAKPRGAKKGPVFRLPGDKGWKQVTNSKGEENPVLRAYKAGGGNVADLEMSTWDKVKDATAKSSAAKAAKNRVEYTESELKAIAAEAKAAGQKADTQSNIWAELRSGKISSGQAHSRFNLAVVRPASAQRSGFCVYSAKDGKKYGQPRSMLDVNGDLTKSALAEAQSLSGKKGDLTRPEILRILQKALRDGTLVAGPGGKKCAGRGDDGYHDLMQMK